MALAVGDEAPGFALPLKADEAPVRLSDYKGEKKVVLLFFPLAYSSVCTKEMRIVGEDYESWRALAAEVIGISVDSPYVNQRFAQDCGVRFPILSDFNREVVQLYGVARAELHGLKLVANRAAFVIDRGGRIAYTWVTHNPGELPPFDEIREAVRRAA
ncbi:MAG: redoxin domain-containing protein [Gemmatimonadetes bacterium]|nr:redoxin domain-containing protein [Gemmatimonadota bacterium]